MIILTSYAAATYKAQIRSSQEKGFKQLYTGSCTMGEEQAAKAIVAKWFTQAAADSVRQVKDGAEIDSLVGDFFRDPKRKQVFSVWTFNPAAKDLPSTISHPPSAKPIDGKAEVTTDHPDDLENEDPRWKTLRETLQTARDIGRSLVECKAWIGWQLACLKKDHGCVGSGRRKVAESATLISWPEIVKAKTGLERRTADEMIRIFDATQAKLKRLKAPESKAALAIFRSGNPLSVPPEQREHLRDIVASVCTGHTVGSMLEELGVVPRRAMPPEGPKSQGGEMTAGQMAFFFFEPLAAELLRHRSSADFDKLVIALPLHPDEQNPVALSTIEADLRAILEKVASAKAAHAKPAKAGSAK